MKLVKTNKKEIISSQEAYFSTISVPLDDYWTDGVIGNGIHYKIMNDSLSESVGYLTVNKENILLHFVLYNTFNLSVFVACMKALEITKAYACTYDSTYFKYCKLLEESSVEIAYFYQDIEDVNISCHGIKEVEATEENLNLLIEYSEGPEDWLRVYLGNLIKKNGLYIYYSNNEIVGTGELRQKSYYANIGMTVSLEYRKQGIGSYILNQMKIHAKALDLIPVCGTDVDNVPSQKTIEKCGFKKYHSAYEFKLRSFNEKFNL